MTITLFFIKLYVWSPFIIRLWQAQHHLQSWDLKLCTSLLTQWTLCIKNIQLHLYGWVLHYYGINTNTLMGFRDFLLTSCGKSPRRWSNSRILLVQPGQKSGYKTQTQQQNTRHLPSWEAPSSTCDTLCHNHHRRAACHHSHWCHTGCRSCTRCTARGTSSR